MKKILSVLLACLTLSGAFLFSASCGSNSGAASDTSAAEKTGGEIKGNVMIQIEMENGGIIKLELYPDGGKNNLAKFNSLL